MNEINREIRRREEIIIEEGGIVPMFEVFYIEALIDASGRAVEAFRRFDSAQNDPETSAAVISAAHEALSHTASVSRFFWPPRLNRLATARAQRLRMAFGLTEGSALYDRELRNILEHYEERLDQFLLQQMAGLFFPTPLVGSASLADDVLSKVFRLVDPDKEVFVLFGKKYEFGSLRQEVEQVFSKALLMSSNGGRLPN